MFLTYQTTSNTVGIQKIFVEWGREEWEGEEIGFNMFVKDKKITINGMTNHCRSYK